MDNGVTHYLYVDQGPQYHLAIGKTYIVSLAKFSGVVLFKVYEAGTSDPGWQLSVADANHSGKYFGFSTWNTLGYLDNVVVEGNGTVPATSNTWGQIKSLYLKP